MSARDRVIEAVRASFEALSKARTRVRQCKRAETLAAARTEAVRCEAIYLAVSARRDDVVALTRLLESAANSLESVMSTDPDMPSHESTMKEAEAVLAQLREELK